MSIPPGKIGLGVGHVSLVRRSPTSNPTVFTVCAVSERQEPLTGSAAICVGSASLPPARKVVANEMVNVTVHATSDRGGVDVRVVALRGGVRTGNCLLWYSPSAGGFRLRE
jgi:hypothetical protein